MARKKCLEENNEDEQRNHHQKNQNKGLHLHGHGLGMGGGAKPKNKSHHGSDQAKGNDESNFAVMKQLSATGLTIREMPGDGNCLFRALADQLEGHTRNHVEHRRAVVQYMRDNRPDFEPFVEDDVPFEKYVQSLSQPGTFAGNDAIVAFARLHNVTVVIHQLNSPAWLIHPSKDELPNGREVHIAYHNGDHYNSVRKLGDDSESPSSIKLQSQGHSSSTKPTNNKGNGKNSPPHKQSASSNSVTMSMSTMSNATNTSRDVYSSNYDAMFGRDEDYWVKDSADVDRLVEDVMRQTDYPDPNLIRDTLLEFNFDMVSTVEFVLSCSILMCQQPSNEHQDNEESKVEVAEYETEDHMSTNANMKQYEEEAVDKEIVNYNLNSNCEQFEDQSLSNSSDKSVDSDEKSNVGDVLLHTSHDNEGKPFHKERLSARQKKDNKKKERKREADLRKKRENGIEIEGRENNVVVVSNLGSLDI